MSDTAVLAPADERALVAVADLAAATSALLALDLTGCTDDTLLAVLAATEAERRRAVAFDHRQLAELDQRGTARERGYSRTADLLVASLRIDRPEAMARVVAAQELGPRRDLGGQPLEPIFASVADACADGTLSAAHARIVRSTVDALPESVAAEKDRDVEVFLVEQARQFEPRTLKLIARRLLDTVDPDGTLSTEADRSRRRHITAHRRADGSVYGTYDLEAITGEAFLTVLDTLARPEPANETGDPDRRTPGQRRHDALHALLMSVLRSGTLPACGGVAATILVTMTAEQAATGAGLAKTAHGGLIPTSTALTLAGEAQVQTITLDPGKGIEAYSSTQRIFTQQQRLAMIARDGGCSVPGCSMPAALTEAHHIVEWSSGGRTSVDNGTLICSEHHRELPKLGYHCAMQDGIPHWTAPPWLDPTQTPRRNLTHHPELVLTMSPVSSPTGVR